MSINFWQSTKSPDHRSRSLLGSLPATVAVVVVSWLLGSDLTQAANLTWSGTGTTAQWTNGDNWTPFQSGGPVAADNLFFEQSPTISGSTAPWLSQSGGSGTNALNSITFSGPSSKYLWAANPTLSSTYTTQQFLHPSGGITMAANSGAVFIGNANQFARSNLNIRLQANQRFENNSANPMTFGTPPNTTFDPATLVGGNESAVGFVLNGRNTGTTPTVLTLAPQGFGDIVFNGNLSNGTGGLQVVVDGTGTGRVIANGNVAVNSANLGTQPGLRILNGVFQLSGTQVLGTNAAGVEIAANGALVVDRSANLAWTNRTFGAGTMQIAGGGTVTVTGSLQHTGTTTISAGRLQVELPAGSIAGPVDIAAGATLDFRGAGSFTSTSPITGAGNLFKGGAGTLTLTGPASFTGGIQIDDDAGLGKLAMSNVDVSQLTAVSVPSTLAIAGGGTLDIAEATPGGLAFRLGTASDSVTMGRLDIGSGVLNFDAFNFTPEAGFQEGVYDLFTASFSLSGVLGGPTSGTVGGLPANLILTGNSLQLEVVPEPASAVIGGLGLAGLVLLRLRRRRTALALAGGVDRDHVA